LRNQRGCRRDSAPANFLRAPTTRIPPQPVRRSASPERQLAGAVLVVLPQQDEQSFAGFLTELTLRVIRPPCVFRFGGLNRCCHVAQHDHCSTFRRVLVNRPLVAAAAPPDLLVCAKDLLRCTNRTGDQVRGFPRQFLLRGGAIADAGLGPSDRILGTSGFLVLDIWCAPVSSCRGQQAMRLDRERPWSSGAPAQRRHIRLVSRERTVHRGGRNW